MRLAIISLFPEMFDSLNCGITGRAIMKGQVSLKFWNPRDFVPEAGVGKYRAVDDRPYGGGPGMVMMIQPLRDAIRAAKSEIGGKPRIIHLSPQGKVLTQESINVLAQQQEIVLVTSRYEGVDERLLEEEIDEEWSIGDYVLTGGELPAMVLIDAMIRLMPGVLGHPSSATQDSFMNGLLDCPHYTRPEAFKGKSVPKVLLEGNHQAIASWRLKQALGRTWLRRPELLKTRVLTPTEQQLLNDFIREYEEFRGKTHE
ncbi:MAG: tRNA (guanosine(37)-N1)-methyltransferase TrmD [Gammaproteobacteria bacterium]|nr:tRNA (guanosine(37)-N1)-methyltransferase TrmD [Gammaproteobacteria bacterium]